MTDIRGIKRGKCKLCSCTGFQQGEAIVTCLKCHHPPVKHERLDQPSLDDSLSPGDSLQEYKPRYKHTDVIATLTSKQHDKSSFEDDTAIEEEEEVVSSDESSVEADTDTSEDGLLCSAPNCHSPAYFDINSGESSLYCEKHKDFIPVTTDRGRRLSQTKGAIALMSSLLMKAGTCKLQDCSNPCYVDPASGKIFDYCCRFHGRKDMARKQQEVLQSGQPLASSGDGEIPDNLKCSNPLCYNKKYQEKDLIFDYCGRTCRDLHLQQQKDNPQLTFFIPGSNMKQCLLPGCKLPRQNPSQTADDQSLKSFCGLQHRNKAEVQVLLDLPSDHKKYKTTVTHFINGWNRRKSAAPANSDIVAVFKIFNPKQKKSFDEYVNKLSDLSVQQFYHGTSIKCDLLSTKCVCTNKDCGICGISKKGFCKSRFGFSIPRFKRFGDGFYLAPNSSKCHDYTQGHVDYRVMLLCDVAPGNKYTVQSDQVVKLKAPPQGYDSVYGAHGGNLNYDEIVLYRSESILPKYAIVYKRDGINKIAK